MTEFDYDTKHVAWPPYLEVLRREFVGTPKKRGEPLALNEAYAFCYSRRLPLPRWVKEALADRLIHELNATSRSSRPTPADVLRERRHTEITRWFTVKCFLRNGYRPGRALVLAADYCHSSVTRVKTAYKNLERMLADPTRSEPILHGPEPEPRALALNIYPTIDKGMTPADLIRGYKNDKSTNRRYLRDRAEFERMLKEGTTAKEAKKKRDKDAADRRKWHNRPRP